MDENRLDVAQAGLAAFLGHALPRMLTQVDRDALSPTYGSFDRNWWHYKIRDFPSIILQQGGYALHEAARGREWRHYAGGFEALAAASARFWCERALRFGAFEEYYPWEQGYPPLAFSTLAVAKLVADQVVDAEAIAPGAAVAARQLAARFEAQAANQQVAGLAALSWLRRSYPDLVRDGDFALLRERTLALQRPEGWFVEYDGPDLGYLSVTLDCLWDLWDATCDRAYLASITSAIAFMEPLVDLLDGSVGMHNARNTDYVVPYGLLRTAVDAETASLAAARIFALLFADVAAPDHFLHAVDDRYLVHYVGHSIVRAAQLALPQLADLGAAARPSEALLHDAGYALIRSGSLRALVALRKGGILSVRWRSGRFSDFGWTVETGGRQLVSQWWNPDWKLERVGPGRFTVDGRLIPHRHLANTPLRHLALRLATRVFGKRLIGLLKRRLIFRARLSDVRFRREVALRPDAVQVTDRFTGLPKGARLVRSPRASKRHVASANGFHREDFVLLEGVTRRQELARSGAEATVTTTYRPDPAAAQEERRP